MATPNPPISKIEDNLYICDGKSSRQRQLLEEHKIRTIVSLSVRRWVHWNQPWYKNIIPDGNHLYIPCKDSMTQDLLLSLAAICDFIDHHVRLGSVLIHCDQGISRSATVMIAYLMRTRQWNLDETLVFVGKRRKIKPNENFKEQLQVWEAVQYIIWVDSDRKTPIPKVEYAAYLAKRAERLQKAGPTGDEPIDISSL